MFVRSKSDCKERDLKVQAFDELSGTAFADAREDIARSCMILGK